MIYFDKVLIYMEIRADRTAIKVEPLIKVRFVIF